MKLFLTGGRGMVGRAIASHPGAANFEIFAPGRDELDLENEDDVRDYVAGIKPDMVVHAAGLVGGIQANINNPVNFLVSNLKIGLNVIQAARSNGVANLLNIGSSCMYPRNVPNPLRESQILTGEFEPTNEGYAIAKVAAARLCDYIVRENPGLNYRTIIPCNLYGPHDKFDLQSGHMIPAVIRKLDTAVRENVPVVDIWGNGEARREFMYVEDLADFVFFALPRLAQLPSHLNVGLGYDYSINEYYRAIADVVGFKGQFTHDLSKPTGMKQKLLDVDLLSGLGWKAPTDLATGISKTYDFYTQRSR